MKWIYLWRKIGKQPMKLSQNEDVKLIMDNHYYNLKLIYIDGKPYLSIEG